MDKKMTIFALNPRKNKQQGVSLLELMITLTLGIILLLVLSSVYVNASKSSDLRALSDDIDETARQVFENVSRALDKAGYIDPFDGNNTKLLKVRSESASLAKTYGRLGEVGASGAGSGGTSGGTAGSGSATPSVSTIDTPFQSVFGQPSLEGTDDGFTVRFQTRAQGTLQTSSIVYIANNDAWRNECAGIGMNANPNNAYSELTFGFNRQSNELLCNLNGSGNRALIGSTEGTRITEIHYRYLYTSPADVNEGLSNSYAGEFVNEIRTAADVAADAQLGWSGVIGIEACVVIAGKPLTGRTPAVVTEQTHIPTCARVSNDSDAAFRPDIARPAPGNNGEDYLYRRFVKVIMMPNASYLRN